MRYLISKNCHNSPGAKNNHFALDNVSVNSAELIQAIIAHDNSAIQNILSRNISNHQLKQIFRYALINSKPDLVKLCITQNVSVNGLLPFGKKYVVPLDIAQINADPQIIKYLIEAGADQQANEKENADIVNIAEYLQYESSLGGDGATNLDLYSF